MDDRWLGKSALEPDLAWTFESPEAESNYGQNSLQNRNDDSCRLRIVKRPCPDGNENPCNRQSDHYKGLRACGDTDLAWALPRWRDDIHVFGAGDEAQRSAQPPPSEPRLRCFIFVLISPITAKVETGRRLAGATG
jgi:hypothetical protein